MPEQRKKQGCSPGCANAHVPDAAASQRRTTASQANTRTTCAWTLLCTAFQSHSQTVQCAKCGLRVRGVGAHGCCDARQEGRSHGNSRRCSTLNSGGCLASLICEHESRLIYTVRTWVDLFFRSQLHFRTRTSLPAKIKGLDFLLLKDVALIPLQTVCAKMSTLFPMLAAPSPVGS